MKNRLLHVLVAACIALLLSGGFLASNMSYKIIHALTTDGSGSNLTGLPYLPRPGLDTASDLLAEVNAQAGSSIVASVSRFNRSTAGVEAYTGFSGLDFALEPGEGYYIDVSTAFAGFKLVGSHDPGHVIALLGPEHVGSATGDNLIALPYHLTMATAGDLIDDIEAWAGDGVVASVSRYDESSDALEFYTGFTGTNFQLEMGEGYLVTVTETADYLPSHY